MTTLREHKARRLARARRRLSRFTNSRPASGPVEVAPPHAALFGAAQPAGVRPPCEPRGVPAPAGVSEPVLAVPAVLAAGFTLPEPAAFGRVAQAAQALEALPSSQ